MARWPSAGGAVREVGGKVVNFFTGGLLLPASPESYRSATGTTKPLPQYGIEWHDELGGKRAEVIGKKWSAAGGTIDLLAGANEQGTAEAFIELNAGNNDPASILNSILVGFNPAATGGPSAQVRLLGGGGSSSFLQLATPLNARISWGQVNAAATIALDGSGDWSVSTSGVGIYTITFSPSYAGQAPMGFAIQIGTGFVGATDLNAISSASIQFRFFTSAGAPTNANFGFIALGRN